MHGKILPRLRDTVYGPLLVRQMPQPLAAKRRRCGLCFDAAGRPALSSLDPLVTMHSWRRVVPSVKKVACTTVGLAMRSASGTSIWCWRRCPGACPLTPGRRCRWIAWTLRGCRG